MIDLLSLNVNFDHAPFGTERLLLRDDGEVANGKYFSKTVHLYDQASPIIVTSLNRGAQINIRCSPLKPLQAHNVFGPNNVCGLGYALIRFVFEELGLKAKILELEKWKGGQFELCEVHITERFGLESHALIEPILKHMLKNLSDKYRTGWLDSGTGIVLKAFDRKSEWVFYDKLSELRDGRRKDAKHIAALLRDEKEHRDVWKLLLDAATGNLRAELKLDGKFLGSNSASSEAERSGEESVLLNVASAWKKGTPRNIYFREMEKLRLGAIPSMQSAAGKMGQLVCRLLRKTYRDWLCGDDLSLYHSESTIRTRRQLIKEAIGVDIVLDVVPSELPPVDLASIFCEENILSSYPDWTGQYTRVRYRGGDMADRRSAVTRPRLKIPME